MTAQWSDRETHNNDSNDITHYYYVTIMTIQKAQEKTVLAQTGGNQFFLLTHPQTSENDGIRNFHGESWC